MIEIVNAIIIVSLILIIYKYFEKNSYDVVMVKSEVNGKDYLVRNLEDKQEASNLLGSIAVKLENLVNIINADGYEKIYAKYMKEDVLKEQSIISKSSNSGNAQNQKDLINGQDGGSGEQQKLEYEIKMKLKDDINRLVNNYDSSLLSETTPDSKYTSYAVNKSKIVFCIRNKKDGDKLIKQNILTFVALHELSHIFTKSISHTPEFWNNFKLILKIAIDNGIYKNIDFNKNPEPYCGITISDTPLKL